MPVIQMDNPLLAGMGAAAQYGQQSFQNNALLQQLALAKLKQQQDNAIAQGQLANQTALVQPTIQHMGAETGLIGSQTAGQNIQNQYTPQVLSSTIGKNNAEAGLYGSQTAGQNLTNRTIIPNANAENLLKAAMAGLYGTEGQKNLADINFTIPAQANEMNAAATESGARASLTNEQTDLMKRMGFITKNGTVNASNAMQVLSTDPYARMQVDSAIANGYGPRDIINANWFQGATPQVQAAAMAVLNMPTNRKQQVTPQDLQKNAASYARTAIDTMYGANSPNVFNSPYAKLTSTPGGGTAMLKLNAAVMQMMQKVGQQPSADQIMQVLQAAASGHPQWGIDQATATMLLAPLQGQ